MIITWKENYNNNKDDNQTKRENNIPVILWNLAVLMSLQIWFIQFQQR